MTRHPKVDPQPFDELRVDGKYDVSSDVKAIGFWYMVREHAIGCG